MVGAMDMAMDYALGLGPVVHHGPAVVTVAARHGSGSGIACKLPIQGS